MKICMVAACLAGGGAERTLLDTADSLKARGHDVAVLTFEGTESDAYRVPEGLTRLTLDVPGQSGNRIRGLFNNLRRIARLRAAISRCRPDVVVSYLTRSNIICRLALLGTRYPVVATEHNVATLNDAPMQGFWRVLRRLVYPHMAQVVIVSKGVARQYPWLDPGRLAVIHNFLPPGRGCEPETFDFLSDDGRYIVGMGRLAPEKRFDRLIRAFQLIEQDCPGWKLLIMGDGPLRHELMGLVASLGLESKVSLPGRISNPRTLLQKCHMFVLSSESEGFPLVLLEAMSVRVPVVSFDCDFGPREIVTSGISGVLVPPGDIEALSRAMGALIEDDALRARIGTGGYEAIGRFDPDTIINQWEELLKRVTSGATADAKGQIPGTSTGSP